MTTAGEENVQTDKDSVGVAVEVAAQDAAFAEFMDTIGPTGAQETFKAGWQARAALAPQPPTDEKRGRDVSPQSPADGRGHHGLGAKSEPCPECGGTGIGFEGGDELSGSRPEACEVCEGTGLRECDFDEPTVNVPGFGWMKI